jgi:ribose transport system permease protein
MNLLKSTALEPAPGALAGLPIEARIARLLPVYGLVVLTVLLAALFSLLLPDTFPTWLNVRSMLADKAVVAMLSLAATVPMMTGKIDLTVGYGVVLWHILAISLQIAGLPWPLAVLVVLVLGMLFGLLNGLLVEVAQIDSFIATLGTGTVTYAVALWWTGGRQVIGRLDASFFRVDTASLLGIPIPAFYVAILAVLLWVIAGYTPVGRYLYAIGANPRAAELNGIPTRRYVMLAFMTSGLITALAGVVLAARLRVGQASVGLEFLLPALVGAFLGSTTINPGRVNIWGTITGVVILAIGISGIQQLGGAFWVEPAFNGATLLIAIGLAGWTGRRRVQSRAARSSATTARAQPPPRPGHAGEAS